MKKALVLLFYIILIALFVSCNPEVLDISGQESLKDEHGIGNLMVSTEGNSSERTIQPESIERSCSSYQIFVKSTTGDYNEVFSTDQKALLIEGLDVDSYEVYVEGVNDLGINIVSSEKQTIVVKNQETTQAEFRLNKYTPGIGACDMELRVPKNDNLVESVKWIITSRSDNESFEYVVDDYHFSLDSSYRCYLINGYIESGNYDIQVIMLDGDSNQVGFTYLDSLHVFKESTSSSVLIWDKEFFPAVPTPFFDVADGTYSEGKIVRIRCNDERAEIYYTTDGSNPSSSSTLYVNPLRLDQNTEVRAVAVIDGLMDSEIAIGSYKIKVDNPVFNIKDQSVVNYDYLTITTSTSGATILYTLDGSTPTEDNGLVYSEPIRITRSLTVKAIATKDNHDSSTVVSAEYYDVNSPSPDKFFSVSDSGEVSVNEVYRNTLPSVVVIPAKIGQTSITAIANAGFIDCTRLKTLVIPNSIVKIGASAFLGCSNIESIDISSYVTEINQSAFSGWTINQSINDYSGLIKAGSLVGCNAKIYATIKTGTAVVSGYTGMENLYGINLPNSVTEIAANAFSGCINLAELTIPDYVVTIGQYAFNNCTSLQTITLPSILTYLSYDAFRGWTSNQIIKDNSGLIALNKLINSNARVYTTIPNNINYIPASIGVNRSDVYGLTIPETVTSIGDYAFYGTNIESITIPETVEYIGLEVFKGWTDDQIVNIVYNGYSVSVSDDATSFTNNNAVFNVSFSDNISVIDDDAFNGMSGLESITIPSTVTSIGDSVFKNTSISSVVIPNNVASLGNYCFFNCDNLTAIELPDIVTSIGDYCFADCSKITTVNLGSGITSIPSHVFDNCSLLTNVIAPNSRGSFQVIVKVPVQQLAVNQIDISVNPTYAISLTGYSTTIYRSNQVIDGDWREFTYEVPDMLAVDYTVTITLKNTDGDIVGSYTSDSEAVTAGNQAFASKVFNLSVFNAEPKVSNPTSNPVGGTYLDGQVLTLSCPDSDSIIYTTDGTDPTEFNGVVYSSPLALNRTVTIKAVGIKDGSRYSDIVTNNYSIKVKAPVFSVEAGHTYQSYQTVELSSDTSGASIHYTLDGTKPNNYSAVYTEPIVITQSCTLKAIAFKDGLVQSDVTSGHYTITLPDSAVVTPTVYELVVKDSNNHIISDKLTGDSVLNVSLSPSVNNNLWTCTWSLDSKNVSNSKTLSISSVGITDGYHILQLTAIYDDKPYSKQIVFRYQQEAN